MIVADLFFNLFHAHAQRGKGSCCEDQGASKAGYEGSNVDYSSGQVSGVKSEFDCETSDDWL